MFVHTYVRMYVRMCVSMYACDYLSSSGVSSSFALCDKPRVHAKIDATGLVDVGWPFWCCLKTWKSHIYIIDIYIYIYIYIHTHTHTWFITLLPFYTQPSMKWYRNTTAVMLLLGRSLKAKSFCQPHNTNAAMLEYGEEFKSDWRDIHDDWTGGPNI